MDGGDAHLVERWRAGDGLAFAALVRRWEGPLTRFLGRLAPVDAVPDLAQEAFLRMHPAAASYRENGRFSAWLFQIALNVARDAARRRRPEPALPMDVPAAEPGDGELGRLMARAVEDLPVELREVVAWRHDAGLSFEEMARRFGVPASTLKSRFAAALRHLRGRLRDWGYGPGEDP
mgnify:FL=1